MNEVLIILVMIVMIRQDQMVRLLWVWDGECICVCMESFLMLVGVCFVDVGVLGYWLEWWMCGMGDGVWVRCLLLLLILLY